MSLYRILLVDDEEEIRQGMIRKFDWKANGFEIVGDAENGQDAFEKTEKLRPDVIITDIKMPFMDGLTLCKKVYESMPEIKLVIFSGFDDFEYAKKAIKANVVEYILKPVNSDELIGVLHKLKDMLDKEINDRYNIEILRKHYIKSLPVLRQQFLVELIERGISKERIEEQANQYDLDLSGNFWSVSVVQIDKLIKNKEVSTDYSFKAQEELIPLSVKRVIDNNVGRSCRFKSFIYRDNVVVIAMLDIKSQINKFVDIMDKICRMRFLEFKITSGIGSICDDLTKLFYSYKGAKNAVDYRVLIGSGKAIYIDDVEPDSSLMLQYDEKYEQDLISSIKLESSENIQKSACKLVEILKDSGLSFNQYQLVLMGTVTELVKLARSYSLDIDIVFGENFDCYKSIFQFTTLDEVAEWLSEVAIKINDFIKKERYNSVKTIVEKAKNYITQNYNQPTISVEVLCDYLHISPAYFSTIFKRETGINFVTYLTNVRMEEALNLLKTTEYKTYAISEKVGYLDPNYFSYVFKKRFGISPSKYRGSL